MPAITIRRNAGTDSITIVDEKEQVHTFDMSPMKRHERDAVRERLVNVWAANNGHDPVYNIETGRRVNG